jgi:hypothetical protein
MDPRKNSNYAPICLFVYKRLGVTQKTIESLKNNYLAEKSDLFIYSDGAKTREETLQVDQVRSYIKTISGFKSVKIVESEVNNGLAKSVIKGVSEIIHEYGKVIVVEDDIMTSRNFLNFMNAALTFYQDKEGVHSISGYTMPIKLPSAYNKDFYYGVRASSWGWATWDYVWSEIDWKVSDYNEFKNNRRNIKSFNEGGSDMSSMLKRQMQGKINSWAIIFCYHQWKTKRVTVFPTISKALNLGFSKDASNTKFEIPEYRAVLDDSDKTSFVFDEDITLKRSIVKAFASKFSIHTRLKNKILRILK